MKKHGLLLVAAIVFLLFAAVSPVMAQEGTITITKTADKAEASLGDNVTYTYTITNTDNETTIDNIILEDDKLGTIALPALTLAPDASMTTTAIHTIAVSDYPGPLENTATAKAINASGDNITASSTASVDLTPYESSLEITKTADPASASPGETILYVFTVSNNGEVTIDNLALEDDMLGTIFLVTASLDPGDSTTTVTSYNVTASDLPGPIVNTAEVSGTNPLGEPVSATSAAVSVPLTYEASLEITKTADPATAAPGDNITYTYTINNNSDVTISDLALEDDMLGTITLSDTSLNPGDSTTATASYAVTAADLPGPIVNTANVTGTDSMGEPVSAVSAAVSVTLTYEASLEIIKTADPASAAPGDNITYTYTINNNSDVTISDLALEDDMLGTITLSDTSLNPSDITTATASYAVTAADLPGPIVNTANVTGTDSQGEPVSAASTAVSVSLTYNASLEVINTADVTTAAPHETITYTYTVNNNGNVAVSDLALEDDMLGIISLSETSLNPGESTTATASYEVTVDDLPGPIVNTASVTGTDSQGEPVSATSTEVSVDLIIKKEILTKSEILKMSGVPGKGIDKAPGLQKPFNPNSQAAENAGQKDKGNKYQETNREENKEKNKEKNNGNNNGKNNGKNKD